MEHIEIFVGSIGLLVALWALNLQKKEIIKGGEINALVHASNMLQTKIDYYHNIIESKKSAGESWAGLAKKINGELRPLKHKIDNDLYLIMTKYKKLPHQDLEKCLKFSNEND